MQKNSDNVAFSWFLNLILGKEIKNLGLTLFDMGGGGGDGRPDGPPKCF